ncbi:hypothetical protein CRENBAI_012640 [Crenichthys baileyi]|uniref:Uncharacterized protein n=1 Tax=Crenichthys baileyi TaxID=28760 RepID=A0AAV9RMH8_9TELE
MLCFHSLSLLSNQLHSAHLHHVNQLLFFTCVSPYIYTLILFIPRGNISVPLVMSCLSCLPVRACLLFCSCLLLRVRFVLLKIKPFTYKLRSLVGCILVFSVSPSLTA